MSKLPDFPTLFKAHFYTLNAALASSAVWFAANVVCQAVNVLNPSQDILALATVELELDQMGVGKFTG